MHSLLIESEMEAAIARFFLGSKPLYEEFRAGCLTQFSADMQALSRGLQQCDTDTVRRVAHNIKSALIMLGHNAMGAQALSIELAAQAGQLEQAADTWRQLCVDMNSMQSTDGFIN